jgi:hypothetical protein
MKTAAVIFLILSSCCHAFAQGGNGGSGSYPIPGSQILAPRLKSFRARLGISNAVHAFERTARPAAWNFSIGYQRTFWATDIMLNTEYSVQATCRAVGTNCYIFVEDSNWNTRVTQAAVNSVRAAFDSATPGNASKGIFEIDTSSFGPPPDVDNDPRIIILILNIRDGYSGSGGYVAGYFYDLNEYPDAIIQKEVGSSRHSNDMEIYYVDCNPLNLTVSSGIAVASSVTAHEFQHMIHWNYDHNDITATFINEGLSECASALCGYSLPSPSLYVDQTNVNFFTWHELSGDPLPDYSRAALFNWYLIEQFGPSIAKYIEPPDADPVTNYNHAFQSAGLSVTFLDILKNFAAAVELNSTSYDSRYGFSLSLSTRPVSSQSYTGDMVNATLDTVQVYATRFIDFSSVQSLFSLFSSAAPIAVKAIVTDRSAGLMVDSAAIGKTYALPSKYSSVVFAVTNLSSAPSTFTFQTNSASLDVNAANDSRNPVSFGLEQNYPNPFNPTTTISFKVTDLSVVTLKVFDILGREVATLADGVKSSGRYTVTFDGSRLSSGLYFYRLQALSVKGQKLLSASKKLVLLK